MYTTCRRDRKAMVGRRGRHPRPPVLSPRGTGDRQPSDPSRSTRPCVPPTRIWTELRHRSSEQQLSRLAAPDLVDGRDPPGGADAQS